MTDNILENIKQTENAYEYYKNIHNKLKYLKNIYILDYIYKDLNKNYSNSYLQGSDWYIGETLINNDLLIYPPNEFLIIYGFTNQHSISKSRVILNILFRYILNYKYQQDNYQQDNYQQDNYQQDKYGLNINNFKYSNYL